jgi:hypothetical protein
MKRNEEVKYVMNELKVFEGVMQNVRKFTPQIFLHAC